MCYLYFFCLHCCLINIHIFDYPDSRLSGLFTEVPTSPDNRGSTVKIKIMAKFRASRRLRFEDTKRIMSPEIRPKSFGTFEKQAPELVAFSKPYRVIASRCVITLLRLDTFCPRQCTCRVNHFVAVTK